jgi:ADP-ribose pyrophosphatase YjhB (NUDIX family)
MIEQFSNRVKAVGVLYVDLYPYYLDPASGEVYFLLLKRRADVELPGSWQAVSGKIRERERIRQAFVRQLAEKTGLVPVELFKLDHVSMFYDDHYDAVMLVPTAACRVESMDVTLDASLHAEHRWVPSSEVGKFVVWENQVQVMHSVEAMVRNSKHISQFHRLAIE